MALKRYVFAYDATNVGDFIDRYIATNNVENFGSPQQIRSATETSSNASLPALQRADASDALEAYQQANQIRRTVASTDYFAPSRWAYADANELNRDPNSPAVPAQMRSFLAAQTTGRRASSFMHYADVELALAYLRKARSITTASIAALPSADRQNAAIAEQWRCFSGFFRALNVSPWSWAKLRGRWETQIGQWYSEGSSCPMIGVAVNGHSPNGGVVSRTNSGSYSPDLFYGRPTPLNLSEATKAGAWRRRANNRMSLQSVAYPPLSTLFGAGDYLKQAEPGEGSCQRNADCQGATGDAHPLWIMYDGTLRGSYSYPLDPVSAGLFDSYDCAQQNGSETAAAAPVNRAPGFSAYCGAVSRVTLHRKWWAVGAGQSYGTYLPPRIWYSQLIAPLLDYLASTDPFRLIYEVQMDVLGKNLWTMISCGESAANLATEGVVAGYAGSNVMQAGVQGVLSNASAAIGLVSLINPLAGAIMGTAVAALGMISSATGGGAGNYRLDVFGRIEPALDSLAIRSESRDTPATIQRIAAYMPDPPEKAHADNLVRILGILGVTQGMGVAAARARLEDGSRRGWAATDLDDTRLMLSALSGVPGTMPELASFAQQALAAPPPTITVGSDNRGTAVAVPAVNPNAIMQAATIPQIPLLPRTATSAQTSSITPPVAPQESESSAGTKVVVTVGIVAAVGGLAWYGRKRKWF